MTFIDIVAFTGGLTLGLAFFIVLITVIKLSERG